jgi:hypothetical protein
MLDEVTGLRGMEPWLLGDRTSFGSSSVQNSPSNIMGEESPEAKGSFVFGNACQHLQTGHCKTGVSGKRSPSPEPKCRDANVNLESTGKATRLERCISNVRAAVVANVSYLMLASPRYGIKSSIEQA